MKYQQFSRYLAYSVVSMLLVFSCTYSEKDLANELIGSWELSSLNQELCLDAGNNGLVRTGCSTQDCLTWEFRDDGEIVSTETSNGSVVSSTGEYSTDQNQLVISVGDITAAGVFTLQNEVLNLFYPDGRTGCDATYVFNKMN